MTDFKDDVSIIGTLLINGPDDESLTLQAPTPGTDLLFNYDTSGAPNAWSISQSGLGFYLVFGYNAVNPQLVLGAPSGAGTAFIDTDFARPLNINTLPTGTGQGVGARGLVTIGQAGLSVGSLDAGQAPNLQLTTVDGGTDWNVFLGSPGNFDNWFRIAEVGGAANELVILPSGQGTRVRNGSAGSPGHGFIDGSNYGMFLSVGNDALGFSIAGTSALDIESDRTLSVSGTTDYELLVTDDDDIPNAIWVQNEITGQTLDEHSDVDLTTLTPNTGNFLLYNGANWVPSNTATSDFTVNDGTCVANFIDTTGLDFCNTQIGPTAGSAFYIGQRALGTIAVPTAVGSGTKLAGYSAAGYDGTDYYVTSEISFFTTEAFNGTDGGAEMRFLTTPNGSKAANLNLTIEEDGTLNVAGQTDYETKVTDDDDIPNLKRITDVRARGYVETNGGSDNTINYNTVTPTKVQYSGTSDTDGSGLITWNAGNDSFDTSFTGRVRITYNNPIVTTAARGYLEGYVERDRGGVFTQKGFGYIYTRNSGSDALRGCCQAVTEFDCQSGDQFYVEMVRPPDGGSTTVHNMVEIGEFMIERIDNG